MQESKGRSQKVPKSRASRRLFSLPPSEDKENGQSNAEFDQNWVDYLKVCILFFIYPMKSTQQHCWNPPSITPTYGIYERLKEKIDYKKLERKNRQFSYKITAILYGNCLFFFSNFLWKHLLFDRSYVLNEPRIIKKKFKFFASGQTTVDRDVTGLSLFIAI